MCKDVHKENIGQLMDEMIEIEKAIQEEKDRRTAVEEQIFRALGECDFKRANDLIRSMDDDVLEDLQARSDVLKEKAEALRKGEKGKMP